MYKSTRRKLANKLDAMDAMDAGVTPVVSVGGNNTDGDPSSNVLDLVEASTRRQDDLRDLTSRFTEHIANLRENHSREVRAAEADRIDAIRAVDVGAVAAAAQVQATQATTLAAQVASSAEAMRTQVETTRLQLQAQYSAALEPIIKDVTDLRRVQYETAGGKAQTVETRAVDNSQMPLMIAAVAIVGVVAAVFTVQLGNLRRVQQQAIGGQTAIAAGQVEARAASSNRGMWIGIAVAAATMVSAAFLAAAAIAVTLIVSSGP